MNDLVKINRRGLDEIFLSAQTPTMDELNGMVDGRVLAGRFALNIRLVRINARPDHGPPGGDTA